MELVIAGVLISSLVEYLKRKFRTSRKGTFALIAVIAILGASAFKALAFYGLWEAFFGILVIAGAFYAFIIKNVEAVLTEKEN